MDHCLPSAWSGALDYPSAASAVSAMTCVIGAASAHGARGRTSCKRQVSGSNPLTGSQVREGKYPLWVSARGTTCYWPGLSGSTPTAVTDGGGGVDEAPKSRRSARTPDSCGLISCWCRSGFWAGVAAIREAPGCPMRQRVLAASSRGCCLPGARGAGGAGRREQLCARAQNYTRLAIRLRWCRITSRTRSWRMEMPSDQVADLPARVAQWIRASGSLCSAAAQPPVSERTIERS